MAKRKNKIIRINEETISAMGSGQPKRWTTPFAHRKQRIPKIREPGSLLIFFFLLVPLFGCNPYVVAIFTFAFCFNFLNFF